MTDLGITTLDVLIALVASAATSAGALYLLAAAVACTVAFCVWCCVDVHRINRHPEDDYPNHGRDE